MATDTTSNPAFSGNVFRNSASLARASAMGHPVRVMTVQMTAVKIFVLLAIAIATGAYSWSIAAASGASYLVDSDYVKLSSEAMTLAMTGILGALVVGLITIFTPRLSPVMAPIYAALEGLGLGAISAGFEATYPGIVSQAMLLSVGVMTFFALLYLAGIRPGDTFGTVIAALTFAILFTYIADLVLMLSFGEKLQFIHQSGWVGIGFSAFVCVVASLNFFVDFRQIERGVSENAPTYMEWYCAFGVMVTLFWLYIELLRLLAKIKNND